MTRLRLLIAICCAMAIFAIPQTALGLGPVTTPKTFFTEGFESAEPVTYVTSPYVPGDGLTPGYWGRVTAPKVVNPAHGGLSFLWCDGTNATALGRTPYKYAIGSKGFATFGLPQTVDYYKPVVSLWYSFPSAGYSDRGALLAFAPEWTTPAASGVSNAQNSVSFPTGINQWQMMTIDLASETTGKTSLSRTAGTFRLRWLDQPEPPGHTGDETGQGASVDDVTIAGWKFGPVRSLTATTTSISSTLTWLRPWRSYAATSTEERPLSYRVWRAPKGSTDWTELTPAVRVANESATVTYTDSNVTDGTAYTYAVQAWEPGSGDETTAGYGEHVSVDATTPLAPVKVKITNPVSGSVVATTGASGISGTVQASGGATVSSVMIIITREDNAYFNNVTGLWTMTPTTFAAAVSGTTWSSAWIPTAADYKVHTYTITAIATNSFGNTASSVVSVQADSVPRIAPVVAVSTPGAGAVVTTLGTVTLTGSATVQTGLPTPTVQVSLAHGANWWNGSAWTSTQVWLPATVVGSAWTLSGVQPPANEYKTPTYVATAQATDAHGLPSTLATQTFTVDSVPYVAPTVSVSTTASPDLVGTGPFTISGTAAAVHANLPLVPGGVRVTIARDTAGTVTWWNGSTWVSSETSVAAVGTSSWSYNWTPPANEYHMSTFTIRATALDDHGMRGSSASVSVQVDSVPYVAPVAAVTSPAADSVVATTGTFAVTGTAAVQTGLPAATVQVRLAHGSLWWNGSVWTTVETWAAATVNGEEWTLAGVTPPANEYRTPTYVATARATDAHALTGTSATRTFTVDSVPYVAPTVGLAFPENNVDVIGIGPYYTLRGTVTPVHPNLPLTADGVRVFIKKDTAGAIRWWNGTSWVISETSVPASGTTNWTYSWLAPPTEYFASTFTVHATASDAHGLEGSSAESVFKVNSVAPNPPDILFTTPSAALTSQVGTLAVSGTTAGRDGAVVQRVSVHIGRSSGPTGSPTTWWDGDTWMASETSATYLETTYSAGAPTWSYDWKMPTNEYAAHTYVLRAYAIDEYSRVGTSTPVSTQLDTVPWTAPTVSVSTTASPDLVGTGAFTLSGTATPVHASLPLAANSVRVTIARDTAGSVTWWDGSAWVSVETSVAAVGTSAWSYSWMPPANEYHKSTYTIHATALDAHGVMGSSPSASVLVDSVPYVAPVATITSPSANTTLTTTGAISITGSATVQTGLPAPIVHVKIAHGSTWWNGSRWTTVETWVPATLTGTTWRLDGVLPPAKEYGTPTYVATARVTDAHELEGTPAPRIFKVDSVPMDPPTTTVYPPTANPAPAAPIKITGVAALAASVQGSPITLASVRVTVEAKSSTGSKSWWNGTGWQSTQTSVKATGLSAWNMTFTSKPNDNRSYTYTIMSTVTDTHGLSGSSAPVTMSADNVGPRIIAARSLGRYAIEVRFTEKPFAPSGARPIDARYFWSRGLQLRKIIGWSEDGTRVRIMTSAQVTSKSSYRVTLRRPVVDALGN